jgi:hypothetical protein
MENKKNLPVIMFSPRKKDIIDTRGGGGGLPSFVLKPDNIIMRDKLIQKSKKLVYEIGKILEKYNIISTFNKLPIIVKITMEDYAIAKSHRKEIKRVIDKINTNAILGLVKDKLLVRFDDYNCIVQFRNNLNNIEDYYYGISCISDIFLNIPDLITHFDGNELKLKCVDMINEQYRQMSKIYIENELSKNGISYKYCHYTETIIIYKLFNYSLDSINTFVESASNLIISIEKMPTISSVLDNGSQYYKTN